MSAEPTTNSIDNWLDISGLRPPLPQQKHTFLPQLATRLEFTNKILPALQNELSPDIVSFIQKRFEKTFEIRDTLKKLKNEITEIVGTGNFSALWLDREAFSADSMEHRSLVTEAVVHVYSETSLQKIVTLFYKHKIPMIPYGEGGGYNMGVTPMAPAVTISARGIDHISEIRPSRKTENKFEISVGAGVPFKDLVAYLEKRGYVLRCDPNTPRAATGGIAATGSNGGRKAFEVILHGRAITHGGTAVCFEADSEETDYINNEPFLLAKKFFSIDNTELFRKKFLSIQNKNLVACVEPNASGTSVPLKGIKASANTLAQRAQNKINATDTMKDAPTLPISAFVGAEGTTGFIYEVTFEIEKSLPWIQGSRWHFYTVDDAIRAARSVKNGGKENQPEYFELISGQSIKRYLICDFPSVFSEKDEIVLFLAVEGKDKEECEKKHLLIEKTIEDSITNSSSVPSEIYTYQKTLCSTHRDAFEAMKKPRETLPKKLRTKCKTDMEIRTEYLQDVLKIVETTKPRQYEDQKQDVLFGHLTPNHTAIIHWNIGGFDLYDEEQSDIAWSYLEDVIGKAQSLAPEGEKHASARFTGEHGVAGKAPFLWLNHIPKNDFDRMCAVKDILDPHDLFNPDTLFLRTSHARSLRARLLNTSHNLVKKSLQNELLASESYAITEGQRCTRCNSCKVCPVIDAEHELERAKKRNSSTSVLPSKRNILMFMEWIAHLRINAAESQATQAVQKITNAMIQESAALLKKCFYCRRCDKACPVDIQIHPLMRAYRSMGKISHRGSWLWNFIYERLMGEDFFKSFTYRLFAFLSLLGKPFLFLMRKMKFIPDWIKTYTVPTTLSLAHYEPTHAGIKRHKDDNFVLISNGMDPAVKPRDDKLLSRDDNDPEPAVVYIRYRGCMDTFGNPKATSSVDTYFKNVLNTSIVDLEKKMCCGFPFEADGLMERAKQSQIVSMIEISKCLFRLVQECRSQSKLIPKFVVFSNCPTCCESMNEMKTLLNHKETRERILLRAKVPNDFDMKLLNFDVKDTAEIAWDLIQKRNLNKNENPVQKIGKTVGLKVPCHNTKSATQAQMELLKMHFENVVSYDRCCGLSGTGRLKHPKIGTHISEKLFEQIEENTPDVIVSGCPSCRDGVKIQRDILNAKDRESNTFGISGIFEQIIKDSTHENSALCRLL